MAPLLPFFREELLELGVAAVVARQFARDVREQRDALRLHERANDVVDERAVELVTGFFRDE
ncbi:MAG TPA: hypothetical protein VN224_13120, partial [Xanthomonadales bacterium]|nr:hypothetical protein [Xanthomonadales bacterium]